jgi:hypothetical protein
MPHFRERSICSQEKLATSSSPEELSDNRILPEVSRDSWNN